MNKLKSPGFFVICSLIAAALACNFSPEGSSDDRDATVQVLSTSVAATSTAIAADETSASAPSLTQPPIQPSATLPDQAPEVQATEADLQATQAVEAAYSATQTAMAPFIADLVNYGVDPQKGQLAWVQDGLTFEIDQYMGQKFGNNYPQVIVQDFVLSADITWDTEYGAAGCSLVFRSDGNQAAPNQYMVWMTRLANGRVEFSVLAEGELVGIKDFYANGIDPNFNGQNGATNRLTVVGQGNNFTIYTNGEKLGVGDPNVGLPPLVLPEPPVPPNSNNPAVQAQYQQALATYRATVTRLKNEYNNRVAAAKRANKVFPAGIVAMGAVAESGRTVCQFDNAWLFLMAP